MRYADRTANAIELLGGRLALAALMETHSDGEKPKWSDPDHTIDCWLMRRRISEAGRLFIWEAAIKAGITIEPQDMAVVDVAQEQDEAA